MDTLLLVLASGAALLLAYFTYGRWLSKHVFQLDDSRPTPAVTQEDGADFVPTRKSIIFGHHFTSIAGTGPIVGPAIAVMWGWLPAILWVVLGSIFVGAVHDLGSIVISLRNKGRSIGDIAGDLLGPRARLVFLAILIVGLWIVLAVFGLVIAAVLRQYHAAVFPVLVQIPLAVVIGLVVHRRGGSIVLPSIISLALMYASVVWGDWGPLHTFNEVLAEQPLWVWTIGLLVYSYIASVLPVWVLLQPRDYINALQLLSALGLIVAGLVAAATLGGPPDRIPNGTKEHTEITPAGTMQGAGTPPSSLPSSPSSASSPPTQSSPSVSSSVSSVVNPSSSRPRLELVAPVINWQPQGAPPMLPLLFITIACGACSGFHCLVGSGTTSKQIARERDARSIGYGSMLTEGFLATLVIAACAAGIGLGVTRDFEIVGQASFDHLPDGNAWGNFWETPLTPAEKKPHVAFRYVELEDRNLWNTDDTNQAKGFFDAIDRTPRVVGKRTMTRQVAGDIAFANVPGQDIDTMLIGERTASRHAWAPAENGEVRLAPGDEPRYQLRGRLAFDKQYESWSAAGGLARTVGAFVEGAANFVASLGIPLKIAIALMGVMVASFAGTTMDTACRLQRYVVQELARTFLPRAKATACPSCGYDLEGLAGIKGPRDQGTKIGEGEIRCPECGYHSPLDPSIPRSLDPSPFNPFKWLATTHGATLFAVVTALFLAFIPPPGTPWSLSVAGKGGLILWPLFGATNQLLAGFAFVVIAAWLIATRRPWWFVIVPGIFMLCVPASAMAWQAFIGNDANPSWLTQHNWVLVAVGTLTLALEAWLLVEVVIRWRAKRSSGVPA